MPLTERDPNISGRSSRASNMSAASKGLHMGNPPRSDGFPAGPGVMSMLKTSTELGDLGGLTFSSSRMPAGMPRPTQRRSGGQLSVSSAHSQSSRPGSSHQQWPPTSSSGQRQGSMTNTLNLSVGYHDLRGSSNMNLPGIPALLPAARLPVDGRSFSMTHTAHPPYALPSQRSYSSLRHHEPLQRPRSPYHYPTRLKRPCYRPSSPALSDMSGRRSQGAGPNARLRSGRNHQAMASGGHHLPYPQIRNRSDTAVHAMYAQEQGRHPLQQTRVRSASTLRVPQSAPASIYHSDESSDPPSSSPPTPKDGYSMEVCFSPTTTQVVVGGPGSKGGDSPVMPLYYDYSEHYVDKETGQRQPESPVPVGFVHRIKALLEEKSVPDLVAAHPAVTHDIVHELPGSEPVVVQPEPVELPASPVAKRLTREMVLAALTPSSERSSVQTIPLVKPVEETKPIQNSKAESSVDSESISDGGAACSSADGLGRKGSVISDATSDSLEAAPSRLAAEVISKIPTLTSTPEKASEEGTHGAKRESIIISSPMPGSFPSSDSVEDMSSVDKTPEAPTMTRLPRPQSEFTPSNNTGSSLYSQLSTPPTRARPSSESGTTTIAVTDFAVRFSMPLNSKNKSLADLPSVESVMASSPPALGGAAPVNEPQRHSDMVTDAAIRFSMPQPSGQRPLSNCSTVEPPSASLATTITLASSSPVIVSPLPPSKHNTSSVSDSPISPISSGMEIQNAARTSTTHLSWPGHTPLARSSVIVREPEFAMSSSQDNSTTDLRFSTFRYAAGQLPDLKEEPHEDSSIASSRPQSFRFPLPRSAQKQGSVDTAKLFKDSPGPSTFRQSSRALLDSRVIPSLNFSSMNLIEKLNAALETRGSRSLSFDATRSDSCHDLSAVLPERPTSAGEMRAKYRSFFASLDELDAGAEQPSQQPGVKEEIPEAQKADNTSAEVVPAKRPYSPDPALITELNRLSIPSVNNLTQRLSEILPSLKRFCAEVDGVHVENIEDDEEVERVLDDIHKLGQRPPLKDQHSTMRLRALPGKSNLVVVEDDVYEELTHQKEKEKDFVKAALGEEVTEATNDSKPVSSGTDGQKTLSVISAKTGENRKTSLTEPEAPCAAVIRPRSGSALIDHDDTALSSVKSNLAARASSRSLNSAVSRPWNNEASYPWDESKPPVNICLPAPVHHRDGGRGPSRLRLRLSSSDSAIDSDAGKNRRSTTNGADDTASTEDTSKHTSTVRGSKKSLLASLTGKPGLLSSGFDTAGHATSPLLEDSSVQTVDPGDRYPTTGLTPPSNFNLAEVRSFFSDDSERTHNQQAMGTFRKRLTGLKLKSRAKDAAAAGAGAPPRSPLPRAQSAMEARSIDDGSQDLGMGQMRGGAGGSVKSFDGAGGMSKMEFQARKVADRIRNLWFKTGELFRNMSTRRRREREMEQAEWEGSMYSGV
ncbi:hypothetical protein H2201_003901 [Coniosporium apollinis]|uniref:Uncharacterized protein n=1 Tax=Coniosporium apollinis TaxID=61459 RepID=A0ABQ9NUC3_9PEZI|nr:hypothetical protein H2201_003901 [Coniosporium apollinis]